MIPSPIIAKTGDSPELLIDRVTARPDERSFDDIILVDDDYNFLGLISTTSLLRMQKTFYSTRMEAVLLNLDSKICELEDSQNDLKRANFRLNESQAVAKRLTEMRSEFIARFGHEARTPMTNIMGLLSILLDSRIGEDKKEMLSSARSSAHSLLRLIDSVLDYSKIEIGSLALAQNEFGPLDTIQHCLENSREDADRKGLKIKFDVDSISNTVRGDSLRLGHILENLLHQLVMQAKSGEIHIKVSERVTPDKSILKTELFAVDNTPGKADSTTQFDPTANYSNHSEFDDLVTMVSRKIANKMGGTIECKNEGSGQLRYVVQLPFNLPELKLPTKAPQVFESLQNGAQSKLTLNVLVVDDNLLNLEIVRRFLQKKGCSVFLANSGKEALHLLLENRIDGIFMDCQMPELSGYEVTEFIRAGELGANYTDIFITAITASDPDTAFALCEAVGMNHFIRKPVNSRCFDHALIALRNHISTQYHAQRIETAS